MNTGDLYDFILFMKRNDLMKQGIPSTGLLINESSEPTAAQSVFEEIQKIVPIELFTYDSNVDEELLLRKMFKAFRRKRWVFLEIKAEPSPEFLEKVTHLHSRHVVQAYSARVGRFVWAKVPKKFRLLVFAQRNFIEQDVSYPSFYSFFGPVLTL